MTQKFLPNDANRRWWTLAAMCFALFMVMLDNTVVNVALPSIQNSFHATQSALEWTINAYTLTFAVLLVTGGRLGDIFGRRLLFLIGVVAFAAASGLAGLAPTDATLVGARALQGIGAAMMMPGTLSIISNTFPPHERGRAIGTWAGVSAVALAAGPVVGGWLAEDVSWRAIFFINIPVAAIAVAVTLFATDESRDETVSRSVDFPGIATLTVGLASLVLGLVQSGAWSTPAVVALFALAAIGLTAFVAIERRVPAPIVDFDFFRSRSFVGTNMVAFSLSFAMFALFFFLALYMQNVLNFTPLEAGVRFLPMTVVIMFAGPIAGRLADRVGPRGLMTAGLLMVSLSLFLVSRIDAASTYADVWPSFVLMGLGMGLTMSPMSTAAMNSVDRSKAGVASGTLTMSRMVGGTLGVAVLGAIVDTEHGRARFLDTMSTGLTVGTFVALGAAFLAWMLVAPGTVARPEPAPVPEAELVAAG
ncbi:MAG: hypothetical protein QOF76_4610 [Solirubrobacteraceae bacterium]|jgi:EmrB/QacA subfamily drug resistance transporter|nr:hypothetical protein [Solirubrobacteraceae bacterium]